MSLHLNIIGSLLLVLAMTHLGFPKYFQWKRELQSLQLVNQQMMQVHTFFVAFVVALMGVLCLIIQPEELASSLGKKIMLGFAIFWFARLVIQFFWYSPKLWKGLPFETFIHCLFSALWIYFTVIFAVLAFA